LIEKEYYPKKQELMFLLFRPFSVTFFLFSVFVFIQVEGHLFKKASSGNIPWKHDLVQEYLVSSFSNLKLFSKSGTDPFLSWKLLLFQESIQSFRSTNGNGTSKK
jgi:hypothetical protein